MAAPLLPMRAQQGIGKAFVKKLPEMPGVPTRSGLQPTAATESGRAKQFAEGLRRQQEINRGIDRSLNHNPSQLGTMTFTGLRPRQPAIPVPDPLLPPPAAAMAPASPGPTLEEFANEELQGTDFNINRARPSRPRRASSGPYAGQAVNQATYNIQKKFAGLNPARPTAGAEFPAMPGMPSSPVLAPRPGADGQPITDNWGMTSPPTPLPPSPGFRDPNAPSIPAQLQPAMPAGRMTPAPPLLPAPSAPKPAAPPLMPPGSGVRMPSAPTLKLASSLQPKRRKPPYGVSRAMTA